MAYGEVVPIDEQRVLVEDEALHEEPRCQVLEGGGEQCELAHGHEGRHGFERAIAAMLERQRQPRPRLYILNLGCRCH